MEKEDLAKRYRISLSKLEEEQRKLGKAVLLRDAIDFKLADMAAGCHIALSDNKIISAIVILNKEMQIIEQRYSVKKAEFPYISGFRAYRELPVMMDCFSSLQEHFDFIFIEGHGIAHPRGLGIASHFGVIANKPSIGIAQKILFGEIKEGTILIAGKPVGIEMQAKKGSKPIYVSPGNLISLGSAAYLAKEWIISPHKLPEPLVVARKYANKIVNEFSGNLT